MPTLPRMVLLAAVAVSAVVIGGCGATPPPEPSPSPSASPVFASEEEALAAATEAYAAYLAVSDLITNSGGSEPERMAPLVTPDYYETELAGLQQFQEVRQRTEGSSKFDTLSVQQYSEGMLIAYLCTDISQLRLYDEGGSDITPANRPDRVPLEVEFLVTHDSPNLLLDRSDVWNGENFC